MNRLSQEEKEMVDSYERGEWRSVRGLGQARKKYSRIARATFRKDKRVNIRISSKDLEELKKRAIEEGIPYQTLIASVLHRYASGALARKAA